MPKTIGEINEKLKQGKAVVVTAEEAVKMAKEQGVKECAKKNRRGYCGYFRRYVFFRRYA